MRRFLVVAVVLVTCVSAKIDAQTNPLWSEQSVRNFLPHMTWPEVRDLLRRTEMVLIPVPALEQYGLHGPIGTDYYTGVERSKLIAQRTDVLGQVPRASVRGTQVNVLDNTACSRQRLARSLSR
jgi:hypothetical protein